MAEKSTKSHKTLGDWLTERRLKATLHNVDVLRRAYTHHVMTDDEIPLELLSVTVRELSNIEELLYSVATEHRNYVKEKDTAEESAGQKESAG